MSKSVLYKRLAMILTIVAVVSAIIYIAKNHTPTEAVTVNNVSDEYEEKIRPYMFEDNVCTKVIAENDEYRAVIGYAISGPNGYTVYERKTDDEEFVFELWNNMEQYYLHVIDDGEEWTSKIKLTEESRQDLSDCIYSVYIQAVSYLGVAGKDRIVSFEETGEGIYHANASFQESSYEMVFTVDEYLKNIEVDTGSPNGSVNIEFTKFKVSDMSEFEDTDKEMSVKEVIELYESK